LIPDISISTQTPRKIVLREALAVVASALLFPFGIAGSKKRTARKKEQHTIVFVHGYVSNRSSFLPMMTYLRALGLGPVLCFNYKAATSIEKAAAQLREFLKERVRGGRVDLVCHSLGGVIARVYLQDLGGARRVDRCITLGTPHRGTYNAYWVNSRVGRDLRPDSKLLERLQASAHRSGKVRFTSIVAGSDNIILPRVFASSGEDVVQVPNVGHLGMLFTPSVFQAVAQRLLPTPQRA